jgi:hypothetical protein
VLLDDVELGASKDLQNPFRSETVAALEALRPGFLRDWQGQLGDTAANRVAPAWARRPTRYRPGDAESDAHYGLLDFLWLCRRVGAAPWVVAPPTMSDEECSAFGAELAQWTPAPFPELLIEFGNENWNPIFRPAGIPPAAAHLAAASRCFEFIRKATPATGLRFILNAPPTSRSEFAELAQSAPEGYLIAVAPYFFYSLPGGLTPSQRLALLRSETANSDEQLTKSLRLFRREFSVYEVGLHTVEGTAKADERTVLLAGAPSGAALAWKLLGQLQAGVGRQCIYTLSQFDTRLSSADGFASLWGVTRVLENPPRLRPTGQIMALINSALPGEVHTVQTPADSPLKAVAVKSGEGWSYLVASLAAETRLVRIRMPEDAQPPASARVLASRAPQDTNEEVELIAPARLHFSVENGELIFRLPPMSFGVLEPSRRNP